MQYQVHHVSFIVADIHRALGFYRDVLGMELDPSRPELGYPGAWINVGEYQVHLLELENPDPVTGRPEHGGRDRHAAFSVDDFDELTRLLEANNVNFTLSKSGRKALFCRDPDGNALEFIARV